MFCANARLDSTIKIDSCEEIVKKAGERRECERVIVSRDATPDISEEIVIVLPITKLVCDGIALQALCLKERAKHIFENIYAGSEMIKNLFGYVAGTSFLSSFKKKAPDLLFRLDGR